jgi:hypothetical protein
MNDWPDWASILPDDGAPLPLDQDPDFLGAPEPCVRGAFVRLDGLPAALARRQQPQAPVAVHADVLRIESPLVFEVRALTVQARRIELGPQAALVLRAPAGSDPACRLSMRADEWAFATEGDAHSVALSVADLPFDFWPGPPGGGLDIRVAADGSVDLHELATPIAGDALAGQIVLATAQRLPHCPRLPAAAREALPRQMAAWIARTGGDPLLRADAQAFVARLATARGRRPFVPYLKLSEYESLAGSTLTALQAVDDERRRLFDRQLGLQDQQRAGEHLLAHYRNAHRYADQLLDQAAADMARAADALARAQDLLQARSTEVQAAQKRFEQGLEERRQALERQVVWTVLGGLALVAVGVATVWFTGPAGAATAATGATAAAKAGAEAAEQLGRLARLLAMIGRVVEVIQKIKGFYEGLKQVYDALHDPIAARQRAEAAAAHLPPPLDPEDLMGDAEWREFDAALEGAFQPALDEGIAGAAELLLAMRRLAIRGQDLVASQQVLDRSQQTLQQRLWQHLRDEADIADMQQRLSAITEQAGPGRVLLAYHGQLRDRLRFRLVHAIAQLSDAYRYETLSEPSFQPDLSAGSAELAAMLSDVRQRLVTARERRGAVGSWHNEPLVERSSAALAGLQRSTALSWVVGLENFRGLDRVRVQDVRVWFDGAAGTERFHVVIETPGDYVDRRAGTQHEFASWPLRRSFLYSLDARGTDRDAWGRPARITLHADDAEGDFFEPAAFSTWTISLPADFNPGLDLQAITGVALEFSGTAQGAVTLRGARRGATRGKAVAAAPVLLTKVVTL